jgi:hypothetical protein
LIPNKPWENVPHCSNGIATILMVVDRFSKLAKMAPTNMIATTFESVASQDAIIYHK